MTSCIPGLTGKKEGKTRLMNMVMQLRKICQHPFVWGEVEDAIDLMPLSSAMKMMAKQTNGDEEGYAKTVLVGVASFFLWSRAWCGR